MTVVADEVVTVVVGIIRPLQHAGSMVAKIQKTSSTSWRSFRRFERSCSITMSSRIVLRTFRTWKLLPTYRVALMVVGLKPPISTITSCALIMPKLANAKVCFTAILKDTKSSGIFFKTSKSTL